MWQYKCPILIKWQKLKTANFNLFWIRHVELRNVILFKEHAKEVYFIVFTPVSNYRHLP